MYRLRGHPIRHNGHQLVYEDTGETTAETWRDRPCGHCGEWPTKDGHDPCIGTIVGVANACCGHGDPESAYVQFANGDRREGVAALKSEGDDD